MATSFAPPCRSGAFLYSSVFYADAGNNNHHPRASVAELAALLRPDTRLSSTQPGKDQVGHWYTAQLIHYGLPLTKDKNAAKVRLLNALNAFKLEVPAAVLKIEADLRREWEGENRKLKKGGKGKETKAAKGKKGKVQTSGVQVQNNGVNVTVNLSLPGGFSMPGIAQSSSTPQPKPKPSPAKRKRSDSSPPPPSKPAAKRKLASSPAKKPATPKPAPSKPKAPPKKPRGAQDAPTSSSQGYDYDYARPQSPPTYSPPPYAEHDPYAADSPPPAGILLSGTYSITCAQAVQAFSLPRHTRLTLTLVLNPSTSIWWARYTWGAWDMILQLNPGPSGTPLGQPCTLGWRLRDLDTGELRFGKRCTGTATFYRDQSVEVALAGMPGMSAGAKLEFGGRRMAGGNEEGDMQGEWEEFVREAYGR
ncbi:hypothetical protein BDV95DRAFT_264280 [Massariosphaeria phaeospora]|uniref:Uncharacterized protein n=1 Tax=Massariosphaeria phaeospora TaxID=100035 RepID=A0A7C8M6E1_9PLEO|nr:hypothetical protein BDV95DRAFT_264280 [Massariosphaeria phaeospora]